MLNDISNAVVADPLQFDGNTDFGSLFVENFSYLNETADLGGNFFWRYTLGSETPDPSDSSLIDVNWIEAQTGASDNVLTDHSFDGWIYVQYDPETFAYVSPVVDPRVPVSLPEPSAVLVLAGVPAWLLRRRKAR
jgi:hypothetical protein